MEHIDTRWFTRKISASPFRSQRRLARMMRGRRGRPLDPAALSLALRGKRDIRLAEVDQLAKLLRVPVADVLQRCGLRVH